jgi:hypothetical protein
MLESHYQENDQLVAKRKFCESKPQICFFGIDFCQAQNSEFLLVLVAGFSRSKVAKCHASIEGSRKSKLQLILPVEG